MQHKCEQCGAVKDEEEFLKNFFDVLIPVCEECRKTMRFSSSTEKWVNGFYCIVCFATYVDEDVNKNYTTSVEFDCSSCGTKLKAYRNNLSYKVFRRED